MKPPAACYVPLQLLFICSETFIEIIHTITRLQLGSMCPTWDTCF